MRSRLLPSSPSLRAAHARRLFRCRRGAHTLVVAEHNNRALDESTLSTITAASKVGGDITVLVAGKSCKEIASTAASLKGVSRVLAADHPAHEHGLAESLSPLIAWCQQQGKYTHIFAPATTYGKNIIPRVAATLDAAALTDVIAVENENTFQRPIYAGNAIATVRSDDPVKLATVRTTAFEKASESDSRAEIKEVSFDGFDSADLAVWESENLQKSDRPELTSAKVVVSGGRGVKSKENFKLIEQLADKLNGAVGASRAAVDAGYAPNDWQVGQTGNVVAPDLYIAVGISGQIQHLAGMKDSKVIVAINNNAEAPIFQVADYGLVADLFVAVPELTKALAKE